MSQASIAKRTEAGEPPIGIGSNTRIQNAIIDKNARIGNNCIISPAGEENCDAICIMCGTVL